MDEDTESLVSRRVIVNMLNFVGHSNLLCIVMNKLKELELNAMFGSCYHTALGVY